MGERSAVRPKSGESVSQSDPGLRRPTPPSTAGRKPAARPPFQTNAPLALRGWLSLKLAGVRGRALPYRPSVTRWALSLSFLNQTHPLSKFSTIPKLQSSLSFSPCSIAGIGRHMATDPCSPTSFLGEVESSNFLALSPTPLPVHVRRLCIHPQETFSCASLSLTQPQASKKAQRGTLASAVAFVIASATLIASVHQSQYLVVVHQGGEAAVSCRLCLIACNSSQFDEVDGLVDESEPGRDR